MSGLQGYSYLQYDQLEELKARLTVADNSVKYKASEQQYNDDIGIQGERVRKDQQQFAAIAGLYKDKADVVAYNSRTTELTQNDTRHEEQMNILESNYANKVSQFEFEKMVAELKANDDSQDARLDLLEQQFADIQVRIVDEVKEKANELVKKTDFNAMIATLQHGDTGLHDKIIQLASAESINTALSNYNASIANLQDKASYDIEINKVVQRNHDFEQRLLGIDQFFRVLAETYKLHKGDENETEIKYTADINSDIVINDGITVNGYKSVSGGSQINVTLNQYLYNTLAGSLKVFVSGVVVGTATQSSFNSVSRVGDINLTASVAQIKANGFTIKQYNSDDTDVFQTWTFSSSQVNAVPDLTPITIAPYSPNTFTFTTVQNVSIPLPNTTGPVVSYYINNQPANLTFNTSTGAFGGSITTPNTYPITISAVSSSGQTVSTSITITIIQRSFYPLIASGPNVGSEVYKNFTHSFTTGNAGTYSFYFKTNQYNAEEYITRLYKVDETTNLLTNATNLSNVSLNTGVISITVANLNNTTSTPNFNLTLAANTTYRIDVVTIYSDGDGTDLGVSIENNGIPVSLSLVSSDTNRPALTGNRNGLTFSSPLPLTIRPQFYTSTNGGGMGANGSTGFNTPNSVINYTGTISPVFNSVSYVHQPSNFPYRLSSILNLPAGTLPTITATGSYGLLSLNFTPNISPISTSLPCRLQTSNDGITWFDTNMVSNNTSTPALFGLFNNVTITLVSNLVPTTRTQARIVIVPNSSSSVRAPVTQPVVITSLPHLVPITATRLSMTSISLSYTSSFTGHSLLQSSSDGTAWSPVDSWFSTTLNSSTLRTVTNPTGKFYRVVNNITQSIVYAITPELNVSRQFYNLIPDTNPDGTTLTNPGVASGRRYFRHSFTINTNGTYSAFMAGNSFSNTEEIITHIYKDGTVTNLLTELPLGPNMVAGTIGSNPSISGIRLTGSIQNITMTPNFSLTLTDGTYHIITATIWNDSGSDLGISLEDSDRNAQTFTYVETSANPITP